ncbi:cytochrome P450 [Calocera cornea HHB12733]|uniref:Cytochrome P450 n=1 Tax=Calocera cornea HHB12733 TaxID=1353952 RepID=A0A165EGB0_9BASI|nr:cytochrome P450 [Calocera cornea HHB12733]
MSTLWVLTGLLALAVVLWQRLKSARSSRLPSYLKGPTPSSWILGNQSDWALSEAGEANGRWKAQYGAVYKYFGCFGDEYLVLNDANALAYIMKGQATSYLLDKSLREFLRLVTGEGLNWAEGSNHARQRRLLSPAFNTSFIKSLVPTFASVGSRLVAQWNKRIDSEGVDGAWDVDAFHWIELITTEALGLTAFGVKFGSLEGEEHPLQKAYAGMISASFSRPSKLSIVIGAAILRIPAWIVHHIQRLPLPGLTKLKEAQRIGHKFANELMAEKRRQLESNAQVEDRDFITVLVRAGEKNQRGNLESMSDMEIYNNLTTFWIAGFETSANVTAFALIELARNPHIQQRLSSEVLNILGTAADRDLSDGLTADELERMPYLEAVLNETLRCHAPIHSGLFRAAADDLIPLSTPIQTETGTVDRIPIRAGQCVLGSIDGLNKSEEVWGPDATEFLPDRWLGRETKQIDPSKQTGGIYANLATFGGGPKACIGYRFALLEVSVFIAIIIRDFEIALSPPDWQLWSDGSFIGTIPMEKGRWLGGGQCPLKIRRRQGKFDAVVLGTAPLR